MSMDNLLDELSHGILNHLDSGELAMVMRMGWEGYEHMTKSELLDESKKVLHYRTNIIEE